MNIFLMVLEFHAKLLYISSDLNFFLSSSLNLSIVLRHTHTFCMWSALHRQYEVLTHREKCFASPQKQCVDTALKRTFIR